MGVRIRRLDFKKQYPLVAQGLFVFGTVKGLPKDQIIMNLSFELSQRLMRVSSDRRCYEVDFALDNIVHDHQAVTFTNIEILFLPSLQQDAIGSMLKLCRNRKICVVWPGTIDENTLLYASPSSPEYYETEITRYIDTYLVCD